MKTKTCTACKIALPITDFYVNVSRSDGYGSECKKCHRAWRREHYQTHRGQTDSTVAKWQKRNQEKYRAIMRNSNRRHQKKISHLRLWEVYHKVNRAVRTGLLYPEPCRICRSLDVIAHHEDYSKPLDVLWYCSRHHRRLHQIVGSRLPIHPPIADASGGNAGEMANSEVKGGL